MKFLFVKDLKEKNVSLIEGKESFVTVLPNGKKIINVAVGEKEKLNRRKFILVCRQIISLAKTHKIKELNLIFSEFNIKSLNIPEEEIAELMGTAFEMANFEFIEFKSPPKEGWNFVEIIRIGGKISENQKKALQKGKIIGEYVNLSRAWANTPGGILTPKNFAQKAKNYAVSHGIKAKILGKREIEKLKMGGILGVAAGSMEDPRFIILEYIRERKEKPIVLVGKGVTFDTGGLNLKPESGINEMHMDMSGGAAVISTILLASRLNLKKNIVVLVPAVENMPSGSSYRPGDILRTMSGKTIEVLNTDAEGRIILADALCFAKRYDPKLVIDVATLTGAAIVALGQRASAVFTNDSKLEELIRYCGEITGDYVWPLPLWEEYEEEIKGAFGDVANIGKTRYGGAIIGAVFLWQFAKDFKNWIHIDIAPRMTSIEGEYLSKGSAGSPVRLLIKLLEKI
jgi:leucyl aminopeptidase